MKEMNWTENQLRTWVPRRPSPRIERRLFGNPPRVREWTLAFWWLTPAAACVFLAMAAFNRENAGSNAGSPPGMVITVLASNRQPAYKSTRITDPASNVSPVIFEWTNRNGSTSSIGSFSPAPVN